MTSGDSSKQAAARDDDEGWHVVSAHDKKRVMRKKNKGRRHGVPHPTAASVATVHDMDHLERVVHTCREALAQTVLYRQILDATTAASRLTRQEILCYGVGNFSKTHTSYFSASMWQLTCLLQMRHDVALRQKQVEGTSRPSNLDVYFYDPLSTAFEIEFLKRNNIRVIGKDEQGRRKIQDCTLAFMPHCPALLYENLLHTNPQAFASCNHDSSSCIVLIGNSIRNLCDVLTPAVDISTLKERVDNLDETRLTVDRQMPGDFDKAFNDTYIIKSKRTRDETKS